MLRVFQNDLIKAKHFVVTLELVPGREHLGRALDAVMGISREAFADGRVSAVSITDNPGGNPSLSPDVIGHDIFNMGMDTIVHFTCRDMNRVGMESRALQLARMGMKNILALNGDYSGQGFGGQGAPVFDLDSVQLQIMLGMLSERLLAAGDPDCFFAGCAVSPFKRTEAECFAQYAKLCRKVAAGAQFIITQLGYDARKFQELIRVMRHLCIQVPVLGSVYLLNPRVAAIMNQGKVPGAVVTDALLARIRQEWRDPKEGRRLAIERAARLAAVLKGLGYKGIHIGGIHQRYDVVGRILDRLAQIEDQWQAFVHEFDFPQADGFYAFAADAGEGDGALGFGAGPPRVYQRERLLYAALSRSHEVFFDREHPLAPWFRRLAEHLDGNLGRKLLTDLVEDPAKQFLLDCRKCGDCAIQHVAFLCPESQCPKHIRNGACGGSLDGRCEVHPDRYCIWFRAYKRLSGVGRIQELIQGCVPPRMWELNQSSSWLNFHLGRDHQSASNEIALRCRAGSCRPIAID
jgi:methylenetetrahydrofolate reductase (NADPH)